MFEQLQQELQGKPFFTDKKVIIPQVAKLLKSVVQEYKDYAIAFSGGIDSTLLSFLAKERHLYSIGTANADDLLWVKKIATHFKWPVNIKTLTLEDAEQTIKEVISILHNNNVETNVVNIGVGCVAYSILKMAKEDGFSKVMTGLGAEEIFAGYQRHTSYGTDFNHIQEKLWEGLHLMEPRDLARDLAIAKSVKMEVIAPFLNKDLVTFAMQIDPHLKITKEQKKIILREAAIALGIPEEFAVRKKKAAQYGSKFDRLLLQLTHKAGFKLKKDYIASLTRE